MVSPEKQPSYQKINIDISHSLPYQVLIIEPWAFHIELKSGIKYELQLFIDKVDTVPKIDKVELQTDTLLFYVIASGFRVLDEKKQVVFEFFE